jgi:microcompartment protein CcmL/EutN
MDALGMIELNSIAAGIEAGDQMLKTADVKLITAQPVCPGKYIVMVQGSVAAVKSSVDAGRQVANETLVDSIVIAKLDTQVFSALTATTGININKAIGVIETFSLVTAIFVADTAVKSANIELIEIRLGRGLGGKSYVVLTGDVSAVQFAVEAGIKKYQSEGMIVRTSVIPSPHPDIMSALI